ncbi:endonuclease domain-containing protein [Flaviaesturariibacter aridisoli]|uniref:Endonuclease domain-containing protein n=1 Tax=Flaviaesturariibacter aridisoli TaxID=2545761 RepID=A0A4V6P693_9BACT|nr:endonuclease domain-containing protein [Flaviaesturariibacter aridisoli]TCZ74722.1 endonuclease domain-containing protein [Flaviaesturariibacter aridisoli]
MKDETRRRLCFHASEEQYWRKINFARSNRRAMTPAESALWQRVRKRQLGGHKFRRQHIIGRYIVDFVCLEQKLVLEVNGGYHLEGDQPQRDAERSSDLRDSGFTVLDFTNEEVLTDMPSVLARIAAQLGVTLAQ